MNNIYVIFYFIHIFATQIYSVPLKPANVYDVVTANFSKNCPLLSSNVLVNSTTKYLSNCKDISLINPPEEITVYNINKFYCIGTLVADLQLCNSLSTSKIEYNLLPKSLEVLEIHITGLQKLKPAEMCKLFKNIGLFNDTTTIPTLSKTITELKQALGGSHCKSLCSDYLNEEKTNVLCSMMFYIHSHITNISFANVQQRSNVDSNKPEITSAIVTPPVTAVVSPKHNEVPKHETKTEQQIANNEELIKKINKTENPPPVTNNDLPTDKTATTKEDPINQKPTVVVAPREHENKEIPSRVQEKEVVVPVQPDHPDIPSDVNEKTSNEVTSAPLPPAVRPGEVVEQPSHVDNTPKNDQTTLETAEGEDQPNQTKITNETPKDSKTVDQNVESVPIDDKDYPTTSTEISNKPISDNIDDYTDDDDVGDEGGDGLKMDGLDRVKIRVRARRFARHHWELHQEERKKDRALSRILTRPKPGNLPKPKAEQSQEDLLNSRADINPNFKQTIDDDVEESNFFSYFMFISVMFIAGYVVYHNKQKIMALVLEGRRDRNSRRRPSTSSYRKLNSNLEEAVTSKCSGSASHVIY